MTPPSTSEAAPQPSGSSSDSRTSAVKLRLVLRQQGDAPGSQCSYNDSLPSDCSFETWRQRVNSKFNAKATLLSFAGNHPLNDEADLSELRRQYHGALKQHTKASVFRLTVTVISSAPAEPQPAGGVLTRRQRSLQLLLPSHEAPAPSVAAAAAAHNVRKAEVATTPTPAPKKQRAGAADAGAGPAVVEVTPITGVSLQEVIRSIVRTVDRHHFGHHLAAAASAAS